MKWFNGAPLALFAASVTAGPIPQTRPDSYDDAPSAVYFLKVKSDSAQVDGSYLSVSDSTVGIRRSSPPLRVTTADSDGEDTDGVSLHPYPNGIIDHVLALEGSKGLFDLKDLVNPTLAQRGSSQEEDVLSWDDFTLNEPDREIGWEPNGAPGSGRGEDGEPNHSNSNWVVFPAESGEWVVRWYQPDPDVVTIQNFIPVDIVYEPARQNQTIVPF